MNSYFLGSGRKNPVRRGDIGIGNVGNLRSCFFCHKKFDSHRALGGHVRSHRSVESRNCDMVSPQYSNSCSVIYNSNPNPIRSLPPLHNTQTGVTNTSLSIPPTPNTQTHQNISPMAITLVHQKSLAASNASLHDRPTWALGNRRNYSEFLKSCIYGSSSSNISNSHYQNHSHFPSTYLCLSSSTAPSYSPNQGSCQALTNPSRFNELTLAQSFNPDMRYLLQCNSRGNNNAGRGDGRKRRVSNELGLGHREAAAKRRNVESFGLVGASKTLVVDLLSSSGTDKELEHMSSLTVIDEEEDSSDLDLGLRL